MRKINFIDCGAFDGCSISQARKLWKDCTIYSFEPLPENIEKIKYCGVNLIKKAVWIEDGTADFHIGLPQSGTLIKGKTTGKLNDCIEVETINFSKWLKDNVNKDDYNIVKMNIEGAEYEVINHLYKNNMLSWISKWFVQWHVGKIPIELEEHKRISKLIKFESWKVMSKDTKSYFT
jgi:FkbM family methyltransferase